MTRLNESISNHDTCSLSLLMISNPTVDQLSKHRTYWLMFIAFVVLVLFRLVYSTPIEFNGESILKWHMGRVLFQTQNWSLLLGSHHELRWSVVLPNLLLGMFFPSGYVSYYITPIIFFSAFTVSCTVFFRHERTPVLLCLVLVCVVSFDPMGHVMASQVNSGAFGLFYCVAGFIFLVRYFDKGGLANIVLCSGFLFLAYAAHITYIVFCAAPVLYIGLNKKDRKGLLMFIVTFGLLFLFETLLLSLLSSGDTSVTGGRVERLWDTKRGGSIKWKGQDLYELHHVFDRWRMLPKYNLAIAVAFCLGGVSLLNQGIRKKLPPGVWLCFYSAGVYGLAISFPIIGVNPIRLALDLHSRYLALFFPLASVFLVCLAGLILSGRWYKVRSGVLTVSSLGLIGIFFAGSFSYRCINEVEAGNMFQQGQVLENAYCRIFRYSQEQNIYPAPDLFVFKANRYYRNFNKDYVSGEVALFAGTRAGVFRDFMRVEIADIKLLETPLGWYSIDGRPKSRCVMELGQVDSVRDNYRDCANQPMTRAVFNN